AGARGEGCAGEEDRRQGEAGGEAPRGRAAPPRGRDWSLRRVEDLATWPLRGVELGLDDRLALAMERRGGEAREREKEQTDEEPPAAMRFPFHDGLAPISLVRRRRCARRGGGRVHPRAARRTSRPIGAAASSRPPSNEGKRAGNHQREGCAAVGPRSDERRTA